MSNKSNDYIYKVSSTATTLSKNLWTEHRREGWGTRANHRDILRGLKQILDDALTPERVQIERDKIFCNKVSNVLLNGELGLKLSPLTWNHRLSLDELNVGHLFGGDGA